MASPWDKTFNVVLLHAGAAAGVCQGVTWGILSLIAIIWHFAAQSDILITYAKDSYQSLLGAYMYYSFIKHDVPRTTMLIQPGEFFAVMTLYFFLSMVWITCSVYAFLGYRRNYKVKRIHISLIVWAITGAATVLLDLIFCSLLAADYQSVVNQYNKADDVTIKLAYSYSTVGYGIILVLAARGFVLWFINLALTGIMIKICFSFNKLEVSRSNDTNIYNTEERRTISARNLPEEARNYYIDEVPRRRQTAPAMSPGGGSTSASSFRFDASRLYAYDPQVERRLEKYSVLPPENKYKGS